MTIKTSENPYLRNGYKNPITIFGNYYASAEAAYRDNVSKCSTVDDKIILMKMILREKFNDLQLAEQLVASGADAIEADFDSPIWGSLHSGNNNIGIILTDIRSELSLLKKIGISPFSLSSPTLSDERIEQIIEEYTEDVRAFLDDITCCTDLDFINESLGEIVRLSNECKDKLKVD